MNTESLEQRIVELETRLSYQDHIIDQLNEVVTAQQHQIDRLEAALRALRQHPPGDNAAVRRPDEEGPPPHY